MSKSKFNREDIITVAFFSVVTAVMIIGTILFSEDVYVMKNPIEICTK